MSVDHKTKKPFGWPKGFLHQLGPTGVEPARPCGHKALNLARLPIPPRARGYSAGLNPAARGQCSNSPRLCKFTGCRAGVQANAGFRFRRATRVEHAVLGTASSL